MSGTLMPILEGFVLFFITKIFFLLFKENLIELQPCSLPRETDSWIPETLETLFLSVRFKTFQVGGGGGHP